MGKTKEKKEGYDEDEKKVLEYNRFVTELQNESVSVEKNNPITSSNIRPIITSSGTRLLLSKPPITEMLIFERGKVVTSRSFSLLASNKVMLIEPPKKYRKDSLWITTETPKVIKKIEWIMMNDKDEKEESTSKDVRSFEDILKANIDGKVVLKKLDMDNKACEYEGTVMKVLNGFCELKKDGKSVVVKMDRIVHVSSDNDIKMKYIKKVVKNKEMILLAYECKDDTKASMSYMTSGIEWEPRWSLFLNTGKLLANLKMQAAIFSYGKTDEIVVAKKLILVGEGGNAGDGTRRSFVSKYGSRKKKRKSYKKSKVDSYDDDDDDELFDEQVTVKKKDYCHYKFNNVCIRVGSELLMPILDVNSKYSEAYKCVIEDGKKDLDVSHIIRLKNESDLNWCGGSVIISNENQLFAGKSYLAQAVVGKSTEIFIEKTKNIKVSFSQSMKKTEKKKDFDDYFITLVICTGVVEVTNYLPSKIFLLLRYSFVGVIEESEVKQNRLEEKINEDDDGINLTSTNISWELEILPGKKKEFNFKFKKWIKQKKKIVKKLGIRSRNRMSRWEGEGEDEE